MRRPCESPRTAASIGNTCGTSGQVMSLAMDRIMVVLVDASGPHAADGV
jgi:hypothetical protein